VGRRGVARKIRAYVFLEVSKISGGDVIRLGAGFTEA